MRSRISVESRSSMCNLLRALYTRMDLLVVFFTWFSLQVYNVSLIRELVLRNMPFLCGKEIRMIFCAKQTFPKDYLRKRRLSRYSKQRKHSRGLLGHENLLEAFKAQKTFSKSSGIEDLFQSFLSDE